MAGQAAQQRPAGGTVRRGQALLWERGTVRSGDRHRNGSVGRHSPADRRRHGSAGQHSPAGAGTAMGAQSSTVRQGQALVWKRGAAQVRQGQALQ